MNKTVLGPPRRFIHFTRDVYVLDLLQSRPRLLPQDPIGFGLEGLGPEGGFEDLEGLADAPEEICVPQIDYSRNPGYVRRKDRLAPWEIREPPPRCRTLLKEAKAGAGELDEMVAGSQIRCAARWT